MEAVAELINRWGVLGVCAFILVQSSWTMKFFLIEYSKKIGELTLAIHNLTTLLGVHDQRLINLSTGADTAHKYQREEHEDIKQAILEVKAYASSSPSPHRPS